MDKYCLLRRVFLIILIDKGHYKGNNNDKSNGSNIAGHQYITHDIRFLASASLFLLLILAFPLLGLAIYDITQTDFPCINA